MVPRAEALASDRRGIDKSMRIRRRPEFLAVQRSPTKFHGRAFLAMVSPSPASPASHAGLPVGRVGITVTRRVGNAVTRNRIKRLVREWMRTHGWVPAGRDVVIIAKEAAAQVRGLADVADDLSRLQSRIRSC